MSVSDAGPRPRRVYAITDAGRAALRAWLATPPAPVRMSNEPLLRLLFADQGDRDDLLRSLDVLRAGVAAQHRQGGEQVEAYLRGEGPFPHRAHLVALFADLYARVFAVIEEWVDDAVAEVETWESTADLGLTDQARQRMLRALETVTGP